MTRFILSAFADEADTALAGQIAALKRNGIYNLEPRSIDGGILTKTPEELREIRRELDANGIGISSLGSPIGKVDIHSDFEEYLQTFRKALSACHILGTGRMRIFSFYVKPEEYATCREEVLRRLTVLLDLAEAKGVTLCHENESDIYGQNPGQVRDLLTSLPRLRGIFDAANYVMNDQDPIEGIRATLPSLEYIHIKDASFAQKCIQAAGEGDGRYEEVLRMVEQTCSGTIFLTLEPHLHIFEAYQKIDSHKLKTGVEFLSSDEAFDYAAAALKRLLAKLGYSERENHVWSRQDPRSV